MTDPNAPIPQYVPFMPFDMHTMGGDCALIHDAEAIEALDDIQSAFDQAVALVGFMLGYVDMEAGARRRGIGAGAQALVTSGSSWRAARRFPLDGDDWRPPP